MSVREVRRLAVSMLGTLGLENSELSISLVNDAIIQEINLEHRGKDKPTDVLSFPQNEFVRPEVPRRGSNLAILGDVVISLDTAERQARGRKRPLVDEVRFLLAHGVLHLLGYDHMTPPDKKQMTQKTRELVRRAALAEPPKRATDEAPRRPRAPAARGKARAPSARRPRP